MGDGVWNRQFHVSAADHFRSDERPSLLLILLLFGLVLI